jgi:hypothetical protein
MPGQGVKGYLPRRCGPQAPIGTVSGLQAAESPCEVATIDGAVLARKTIEAPSLKILRDTATGVVAMVGLRGRATPGAFVLNQALAILVYLSGAQVVEADDRMKRGGGGGEEGRRLPPVVLQVAGATWPAGRAGHHGRRHTVVRPRR